MHFDEALQDMRLALDTMWAVYDNKDIISEDDRQHMEKLSFALNVVETLTNMCEDVVGKEFKDGMLVERGKWAARLRDMRDGADPKQVRLLDSLFKWLNEREEEEIMWS